MGVELMAMAASLFYDYGALLEQSSAYSCFP
jgi:hypothetical protein